MIKPGKPFEEQFVSDLTTPGFDAERAISAMVAKAGPENRGTVISMNVMMLLPLFQSKTAQALLQAAISAECEHKPAAAVSG